MSAASQMVKAFAMTYELFNQTLAKALAESA